MCFLPSLWWKELHWPSGFWPHRPDLYEPPPADASPGPPMTSEGHRWKCLLTWCRHRFCIHHWSSLKVTSVFCLSAAAKLIQQPSFVFHQTWWDSTYLEGFNSYPIFVVYCTVLYISPVYTNIEIKHSILFILNYKSQTELWHNSCRQATLTYLKWN